MSEGAAPGAAGRPAARATIRDVARLAGVSSSAVSKVIRDAYGVSPGMRERVTAAIDELGYRPSAAARAMRGTGYTIGLELPNDDNPFFMVLTGGAMAALADSPYQLVVAPSMAQDALEFRALEALVDRRVDGLVAISPLVDEEWLGGLAAGTPIVMLGRHDVSDAYDTLVSDDALGAHLVMEHLLGLGHRRIVHLTHNDCVTDPGSRTPHAYRHETYLADMAGAGLGDLTRVIRTGASGLDAYAATAALLAETGAGRETGGRGGTDAHRPTAIFAGNDSLALGVQRAILDAGLTHDDVSLASYDDIPLASHPAIGLTSVDQRGTEMGATAIRLLLERFAGRTASVQQTVRPILRPRSSTRPPRA